MIAPKPFRFTDYSGYFSYTPDKCGSFLMPGQCFDEAETCRESFLNIWDSGTRVLFWAPNIMVKRLDRFFDLIETRLGLKTRTVLQRVEWRDGDDGAYKPTRHLVLLKLPRWWTSSPLRKAMLTLFLRCGVVYYTRDLKAAFKAYELLNSARAAVDRFLAGYTCLGRCMSKTYVGDLIDELSTECGWGTLDVALIKPRGVAKGVASKQDLL